MSSSTENDSGHTDGMSDEQRQDAIDDLVGDLAGNPDTTEHGEAVTLTVAVNAKGAVTITPSAHADPLTITAADAPDFMYDLVAGLREFAEDLAAGDAERDAFHASLRDRGVTLSATDEAIVQHFEAQRRPDGEAA